MSYNGSGTFQINTSGQPVVAGTVISATAFNALTADLATGLSTAITKDGQTTTTARIPFAAGINSTLTTDSSSVSTGSIITAGGVGVAKALYVGTTLNVAGASTMTGAIAVDSVTDSTSTTTGSIQTDGGVGIAKALNVGTTANVAGAVTLQSTLGVTGVATFSAAPIYSSLTASSAVATDASKGLVSVTNTGTGNNVLATSPTLVTPILGAASATSITVAAGTVSDPAITTTGDTNTGIFFPAADTIAFSEGGVESARIDASGNMGLGVTPKSTLTSTTRSLQLPYSLGLTSFTGSLDTYLHSNLYPSSFGSGWANDSTGGGNLFRMSGGVFYWYRAASGSADANSSLSESMRIDSSGNLLVGVSSWSDGGGGSFIANRTASGINGKFSCSSTSSQVIFYFTNPNGVVGLIEASGSTTSYVTSSDYRLKENIAPMTGALAKVALLKPCTYKWRVDGSDGQGFIAHELQEVYPDAVTGEKDGEQMQGVDYGKLTPILTAALQEAITKIETLEARIAVLEAK